MTTWLRRLRLALLTIVVLAIGGFHAATGGSAPRSTTQSFAALADATVDPAHSQLKLGTAKDLRVGVRTRALLRFRLRAVHGFVLRANLLVFVRSGRGILSVRAAGKKWSEQRVSFANAPRPTGPTARGAVGRTRAWTSIDVTQLIRGSGTLSLSVAASAPVRLASREDRHAAKVVVETGPDQPAFPIRAAFYYDWYPEAWSQQGAARFTHYDPTSGLYDSGNAAVIRSHIAAMQYGNIAAGIVSWWGQGNISDIRFAKILSVTTNMHSAFRWAVYYENEAQGDPSVEQIRSDLDYIRSRYGSSPSFLKVSRRPVVFVYGDANDGCGMADRWKQANTGNAYIVLKAFNGYRACASQPDAWHQYSPAVEAAALGSSYSISPGFFKANEGSARLTRDLDRWRRDVREMTVSSARFHLITTFNEWGEGTAVESAAEWASPSGYGAYLDALHDNGGAGVTPPNTRDAILLAAGDVASCDSTGDEATAQIIAGTSGTVAAVGDLAYPSGTAADFRCYDSSWGKFKSRTKPAPGNHEYLTSGASAYFDYFGSLAGDRSKGYYSYSRGAWQIIAINSNCSAVGGCFVGSPQENWLRAVLKATTRRCTLAYWHHPLFSSGGHGPQSQLRPIWDDLYRAHAEIVLGGHDHDYERFAPQTPSGAADPNGIREFIVGTGGKNHDRFGPNVAANSEVRNADTFGVLKLTLHPSGYDWKFLPEADHTFTDSGSGTCH